MFNKFELFGAGLSIILMALALYLIQTESNMARLGTQTQLAQVQQIDAVTVSEGDRVGAYLEAASNQGTIKRMVIDDIKIGEGPEVVKGDTVSVHYIGTLQNGTEFDNSKKRGSPFEFTVGNGQVISGWDEGLVGMRVGGQRILVIPPEKAYGEDGIGPIPGNATLVFAIELLAIQ